MIKYSFLRLIFLFLVGGYTYCMIEVIFRGFSHISMLLAGGLAFLLAGLFYEKYKERLPIIIMMLFGMIIITLIELSFGMVVNIYMKLNVWDYSMYHFNYKGQICPLFSSCWFILSFFLFKLFHIIYSWTLINQLNENQINHKVLLLQKLGI